MNLVGQHILRGSQFKRSDLDAIFRVADALLPVARRRERTDVLRGAVLANLFFEPSTRTRLSFGAAFARLGGSVLDTSGIQATSLAKGESLYDTGRVISGYADVIVVRLPSAGAVDELACASTVPVLNAGDGTGEHPTQALLDLYTMRNEMARCGRDLRGLRVAMVGDLKHGRTVHSLVQLLPHFEATQIALVSEERLRMPPELVEGAGRAGAQIHETTSLPDGLADADIVYMTRIQEERFDNVEEFAASRGRYRLTRELFESACPSHTRILHPLPRDSRSESNELDSDLTGHPRLAIFRQTDSGIPIRMALFALVLGVQDQVATNSRPARWHLPGYFGSGDDVP